MYWFRTPPHVKVGRAAFDEDAIRQLEEQHPDVEFDWGHILQARPPAAPETRDPRDLRDGRPPRRAERKPTRDDRALNAGADRPQRRPPPPSRPSPPETPPRPAPVKTDPARETPAPPPARAAAIPEPQRRLAEEVASALETAVAQAPSVDANVAEPPRRRFVRVFDADAASGSSATQAAAPRHAIDPSVAEQILGPEQLTLLRARHAEILARITTRGGEPAWVDALREQAERANPDTWVTEPDVRAGVAEVDAVLEELHRIVGRRRRRRRRRPDRPAGAASPEADLQHGVPAQLDEETDDEEGDEPDAEGSEDETP
jgi:hypothetical protein